MLISRLLEKGFCVLSLLFFTDAIFFNLQEISGMNVAPIKLILGNGISLISILLIVIRYKKVIPIVIREKWLWMIWGIALASTFWSDVPVSTLRGSLFLVQKTLFGVYFAERYSLKEQLRLLVVTFSIVVLLSIAIALALPSYGVMSSQEGGVHAGAWRGIYMHKNGLGRMMVLSAIVFLISTSSSRRYRWIAWAGFILSIALVVLSTSKTALAILLILIVLLPLYKALRWSSSLAIPFFITIILVGGSVAVLVVSNAEAILGAFGRDLTLTGRTELWAAVLDKISERPWLGYGYGGFWRSLEGESADVLNIVRWAAPHSHNGFLDLWLDLGLLGLLAFAVSFLAVCWRSVLYLRLIKTSEGLLPLVYLTFLLLANLTESSLLRDGSLWILFTVITLSTHNINIDRTKSLEINAQKLPKKKIKQKESIYAKSTFN